MPTGSSQLPHVSVIVPVRNDAGGLAALLTALLAQTYPRDRMQVAGYFAVPGSFRRLVTKGNGPDRQRIGETAADIPRQIRIVIARDPDPVAPALQPLELDTVEVAHAQRPVIIVEAVAERDHDTWRIMLDQPRQSPQGRGGVVRR